MSARRWQSLNQAIIQCQSCPRLIEHCQDVAINKRAAYAAENYWGKPVPNFGDSNARLLIIGLAPGAHGANRTGRMFTGDRSGQWLYRALHRAGFANQSTFESAQDGLELIDCAITAVCHCAPPDNKPTRFEIENCRPFLERTWEQLNPCVVVALGKIAWTATFHLAKARGEWEGSLPAFSHAASVDLGSTLVIGSYHPSQQNTFTGRLTEVMLDQVFEMAAHKIKNVVSARKR